MGIFWDGSKGDVINCNPVSVSRLALKILVGAREQGTGNREQEESFGRFYFSSHTFKFFGSPTYIRNRPFKMTE
jgi:hypothetical protein